MGRPDQSNYLAHFTRDGQPTGGKKGNPGAAFAGLSALDKLIQILKQKTITASNLPWTGRPAVCFTECPWSSLLEHAKNYSSYAIGFEKPRVFAAGGGPAYYVRADHFDKQTWENHVKTFVTPFWPKYRPAGAKAKLMKAVDYSHEREWRIPHDFKFDHKQVEFVVLKTYEDMAAFPKPLKDAIGREKFLIMDVYKTIERLWPVHI